MTPSIRSARGNRSILPSRLASRSWLVLVLVPRNSRAALRRGRPRHLPAVGPRRGLLDVLDPSAWHAASSAASVFAGLCGPSLFDIDEKLTDRARSSRPSLRPGRPTARTLTIKLRHGGDTSTTAEVFDGRRPVKFNNRAATRRCPARTGRGELAAPVDDGRGSVRRVDRPKACICPRPFSPLLAQGSPTRGRHDGLRRRPPQGRGRQIRRPKPVCPRGRFKFVERIAQDPHRPRALSRSTGNKDANPLRQRSSTRPIIDPNRCAWPTSSRASPRFRGGGSRRPSDMEKIPRRQEAEGLAHHRDRLTQGP